MLYKKECTILKIRKTIVYIKICGVFKTFCCYIGLVWFKLYVCSFNSFFLPLPTTLPATLPANRDF